MQECAQERVEVVRGGGEVEPGWVEGGGDLGVEFWHSGYGGGVGDEGATEDTNGGGGHGDFDGVVDVRYHQPSLWLGEMSEHGSVSGHFWGYG